MQILPDCKHLRITARREEFTGVPGPLRCQLPAHVAQHLERHSSNERHSQRRSTGTKSNKVGVGNYLDGFMLIFGTSLGVNFKHNWIVTADDSPDECACAEASSTANGASEPFSSSVLSRQAATVVHATHPCL